MFHGPKGSLNEAIFETTRFINCFEYCTVHSYFTYLLVGWYRNLLPALYAIFMGFFFLTCYLCYGYFSRREFYNRLSNPLESLEPSLQKNNPVPISYGGVVGTTSGVAGGL